MVSVIFDVPLARVIRAINCGCKSDRHRLQVGRKSGKRRGGHFDRLERSPVAGDADALVGRRHAGAGLRKDVERRLQQLGVRILKQDVAAGHGHGHRVGAGLDPVGQHRMARAVQRWDALDYDP